MARGNRVILGAAGNVVRRSSRDKSIFVQNPAADSPDFAVLGPGSATAISSISDLDQKEIQFSAIDLNPVRSVNPAFTFTRLSEAYSLGPDHYIHRQGQVIHSIPRFMGTKIIENRFAASEMINPTLFPSIWALEGGMSFNGIVSGVGPNGEDAYEFETTGAFNQTVQQWVLSVDNVPTRISYTVKLAPGSADKTANIGFRHGTTIYTADPAIPDDGEWHTRSHIGMSKGGNGYQGFRMNSANTGFKVWILRMQCEVVTDNMPVHPYIKNESTVQYHVETINAIEDENGNLAHPLVTKYGLSQFAYYVEIERNTAYSVGDKVIPDGLRPYNDGASGAPYSQDFVWLECTVAGTTHATTTLQSLGFATAVDTEVVDGTVTWTVRGLYQRFGVGYINEKLKTNILGENRDYSNVAWWPHTGTGSIADSDDTLNGVTTASGINFKGKVTDSDAAVVFSVTQGATISGATEHTASVFVKKEQDTVQPTIQLDLTGGITPLAEGISLDKRTGAAAELSSDGVFYIEDWGNWWRVIVSILNVDHTLAFFTLCPAASTVLGTLDPTAQGTSTFDFAQLEIGNVKASTPIETFGSTVTRSLDSLTYDISNVDDSEGHISVGFNKLYDGDLLELDAVRLIANSASAAALRWLAPDRMRMYNGSVGYNSAANTNPAPPGIICGSRWSVANNEQACAHSFAIESAAPSAYAGGYGTGTLLAVGSTTTGTLSAIGVYNNINSWKKTTTKADLAAKLQLD